MGKIRGEITEEKKFRQCRKCERNVLSVLEKCPYCGEPKNVKVETLEEKKSVLRKIFRR